MGVLTYYELECLVYTDSCTCKRQFTRCNFWLPTVYDSCKQPLAYVTGYPGWPLRPHQLTSLASYNSHHLTSHLDKGNGQNYCTQTGPTTLQKDRWSLHVPPFPHLKRWCLVCIAPTLSGEDTKKKIQTSLYHFSSNASFMHTRYESLNSNFEDHKLCPFG